MKNYKVGILGSTGYTGSELLRILISHPFAEITWLTSEKFSGMRIDQVFPQFRSFLNIQCTSVSKLNKLPEVDVVFSCLPHGKSMHFVEKFLKIGSKVIDLSADYRFDGKDIYEKSFGIKHKFEDNLANSVYGLPELYRNQLAEASLVANPGCYSTGAILALAPVLKNGLIRESVVVDSKAGYSGGGRAPSLDHHFSETNENISVYAVDGHSQKYEMEQETGKLAGNNVNVAFVPSNVAISRGILTTIYSELQIPLKKPEVLEIYNEFYSGEQFVRICKEGDYPRTKNVRYSNYCDIGVGIQDKTLIIVSALDNLGKGASGQAVQNMNVIFDLKESEGLLSLPIYP